MKILFLITKSNWGGAQAYVLDLAAASVRSGHTVIIAAGNSSKGGLLPRASAFGIRTAAIRGFTRDISVVRDLRSFAEIWSLIRNERPDIMHVNSSKAAGIGAFVGRILGVKKIVYTAHGWPFREDRGVLTRMILWFFSWMTSLLAHTVILVSHADGRDAERMPFMKEKGVVIHNGIDPSIDFENRDTARREIETRAGRPIPRNIPWVWTNSELTKNKGYRYALPAIKETIAAGLRLSYIITSSGEERGHLENMAKNLGIFDSVFFCGFVPDAKRYARAFDVFLLPSVKEGLPYALLEAGLAGVPVVASRVGGIPEIIENGESGILVEPRDVDGTAQALEEVLGDTTLSARIAQRLKERIRKEFSLDRMVRETLAVYER